MLAFAAPSPAVAADGSCPNAELRTGASAQLPDCRAYEVVSPGADKGAGRITRTFAQVSPDGERVAYQATGAFGDATHGHGGAGTGGNGMAYVASRGATGWRSRFAAGFPLPDVVTGDATMQAGFRGATTDLSRVFFNVRYNSFPGFTSGVWELAADGSANLAVAQPGSSLHVPDIADSSADGTHQVVTHFGPVSLVPIPGPTQPGSAASLLYDRVGGVLRLVNADDSGQLLNGFRGAKLANLRGGPLASSRHAISSDGARIFFFSQKPGADYGDPEQLWVRIDGQRTVQITDVALPIDDLLFAGASADGTRAFFTTSAQLTGGATGAGPFLYEYHLPEGGGPGTLDLVAGTAHPVVTTAPGSTGPTVDVAQVIVSDDGSRVYYRSGDDGGSIYAFDTGSRTTALVAAGVGAAPIASQRQSTVATAAEITPDGRHLVFRSSTGFLDGQGGQQVYLYDDATGDVVRVSDGPSAPDAAFDAELLSVAGANLVPYMYPSAMPADANLVSADGRFVFFETAAALVPQDQNGTMDVYRWHDGGVALVSDGVGEDPAYLIGASADGSNVFFITLNDLVPQDGDGADDVYVARVGGGYAIAEEGRTCSGDACQGEPATRAGAPTVGSLTFRGAVGAGPTSAGRLVKVSGLKAVARSVARLRIRVSGPGRISVSGRRVRNVRRSASRAGTYSVTVALRPKARRALKGKSRLRASVKVAFRPAAGRATSKRMTLTFKRPKKGRSRATKGVR